MGRRIILNTERLTLTTWFPSDFEDLAALHADALTMRFIGYGRPDTRDEAQSRLDGYLDEQRTRGWTKWRVENRAGEMIGRAGFGEFGSSRELAYAFRRDQWGRGFAPEVASALVDWHFEYPAFDLPSRSLCAHVEAGHRASMRVLEKVGFDFVDMREYKGVTCAFFQFPVVVLPGPAGKSDA